MPKTCARERERTPYLNHWLFFVVLLFLVVLVLVAVAAVVLAAAVAAVILADLIHVVVAVAVRGI